MKSEIDPTTDVLGKLNAFYFYRDRCKISLGYSFLRFFSHEVRIKIQKVEKLLFLEVEVNS